MDDSYSHFNNNRVKYLHERCLRLICGGKTILCEEQLEKGGSASIYHKKTQTLAIEMFQIKNGMSPENVYF